MPHATWVIALLGRFHSLPVFPLRSPDGLSEVIFCCFVGLRVSRFKGSGTYFKFNTNLWSKPWFLVRVSSDRGFSHNIINALSYVAYDRVCVRTDVTLTWVCKYLPMCYFKAVLQGLISCVVPLVDVPGNPGTSTRATTECQWCRQFSLEPLMFSCKSYLSASVWGQY